MFKHVGLINLHQTFPSFVAFLRVQGRKLHLDFEDFKVVLPEDGKDSVFVLGLWHF